MSRRSRLSLRDIDMHDIASLAEALKELDERIVDEIEALETEVVAIGVGISIFQVRQFRSLSNLVSVSVFEDGQMDISSFGGQLSEEHSSAARFMLDYLSRLIRLIEESDPDALKELRIQVPLMHQEVVRAANG